MFERTRQGAVDLIRGDQPLTSATIEEFTKLLKCCENQRQPRIVLDLTGIPLIDSCGMELLVDCQRQSMARGGCIKLASPGSLCRDILKATNVVAMFEVFENSIAAAGSFAK
ncbi:MAG: STAS domain-containing protein [Fuerstia sp.]|nr:STAS domain-containing protein [Fuerstiella sp.]